MEGKIGEMGQKKNKWQDGGVSSGRRAYGGRACLMFIFLSFGEGYGKETKGKREGGSTATTPPFRPQPISPPHTHTDLTCLFDVLARWPAVISPHLFLCAVSRPLRGWPQEGAMLPDDGGCEGGEAMDPALRSRILGQAQRFLLALVVHDPSRRGTCAEEVTRRGLYLGSEKRQWLFDAVTSAAAAAAASASASRAIATETGTATDAGSGRGTATAETGEPGAGRVATEVTEKAVAAAELAAEATAAAAAASVAGSSEAGEREENGDPWTGPSAEALEAGGSALFAEIRAAAPPGYFGLRGRARPGGQAVGDDIDGRGGGEETLDWVFERKEAERVAKGENVDLVLLEVVMVMLREKVTFVLYQVFFWSRFGWVGLGWSVGIRAKYFVDWSRSTVAPPTFL